MTAPKPITVLPPDQGRSTAKVIDHARLRENRTYLFFGAWAGTALAVLGLASRFDSTGAGHSLHLGEAFHVKR
ncbi:MAG: hypothetical protein AAGD11_13240 [Planctomycetota bacterium]